MEFRKTFYTWITTRFSVIIRSEENLEDKYYIPITPAIMIFFSFITFVMIFALGIFLGGFIVERTSVKGMKEAQIKENLYKMNITVDSLSEVLKAREVYVQDLKKVMGGNIKKLRNSAEIFKKDTLYNKPKNNKAKSNTPKFTFNSDSSSIDYIAPVDLKLRKEFENPNNIQKLQSYNFITPVEGVVKSPFNMRNFQYGLGVLLPSESPIKTIATGSIVNISKESGKYYAITIQHSGGIVSIYRGCSILLKKVGNFVEIGEVIGLSANDKEQFYFEIWYQGNPINPEKIISF